MMTGAHGLDGRLDRLARRVEVVVADRQHDDRLARLLAGDRRGMHLPAVLAGREDAAEAFGWAWHVTRAAFVPGVPERRVVLDGRGKRSPKISISTFVPGPVEIGTQHAERDRLVHTVAPAARGRLADDLSVVPERRHVGRVAVAGVVDDQRDEALFHALLLLVLQRRLAGEVRLVPFDEALEPALQHRVVGGEVALPGAVALLEPQRIQREHAEGLQPVLLTGGPDGVEDRRRVLDLGVDFPAELAREGDADELAPPCPRSGRRLVRQPGQRQVGAA